MWIYGFPHHFSIRHNVNVVTPSSLLTGKSTEQDRLGRSDISNLMTCSVLDVNYKAGDHLCIRYDSRTRGSGEVTGAFRIVYQSDGDNFEYR